MAAIRKKTRMPPKMPRVQKGPVIPKHPKVTHADLRPSRRVLLSGGPWSGKAISTKIEATQFTNVIKVGAFRGRYQMQDHKGEWQDVSVD